MEIKVERPRAMRNVSVVCGAMGGSAAAAQALGFVVPARNVLVHEDYDLPRVLPEMAMYVAVSYSGNTEETLSFAHAALEQGLPLAVVTSGGKLLEFAREHELPVALVPEGLVPRHALPQMLSALLTLFDETNTLAQMRAVVPVASTVADETERIVSMLQERTPVLYASPVNELLTRIGKMYLNEGTKEPAFASIVPARNHDELQGFTAEFAEKYGFVFFYGADEGRVARRLDVLADMYREALYEVHALVLPEEPIARLATGWEVMRAVSDRLARERGIDPDTNPVTTEFKKRL